VRSTPGVLALSAVLAAGHVAGVVRNDPLLARGCGAAALVVLAVWVAVIARSGRWPLAAGLGVLALATAAGYAWDVPLTRASTVALFDIAPLVPAFPSEDLGYFRWTGAWTLMAYVLVAVGAVRLPRRPADGTAVGVAALVGVLLLGLAGLVIVVDYNPVKQVASEALTSLLAAGGGAGRRGVGRASYGN
jgi:hypothetical protein